IRDDLVTGVQTCALPIYGAGRACCAQRAADGAGIVVAVHGLGALGQRPPGGGGGAGLDGDQPELHRRRAAVERENVHPRTRIQTPIAMKPPAAASRRWRGGSQVPIQVPTRTASTVETRSAPPAAATTPQ